MPVFYGRTQEFKDLKQWIVEDKCRLVAIYGLTGIGKTYLAAKLAKEIQGTFEFIIWRSLRTAPPLRELLADLMNFFVGQQNIEKPENTDVSISELITYLKSHRCLLVLDDLEMILDSKPLGNQYQKGYEEYGVLLRQFGEIDHQSCLVLNSCEKPREVNLLRGQPVHSLALEGLGDAARDILQSENLSDPEHWEELITLYRGNPFVLKLVAITIQEILEGRVAKFLALDTILNPSDYALKLRKHLKRLSNDEKEVLIYLARNVQALSFEELRNQLQFKSSSELIEVLNSLKRRSLIEKNEQLYTLHPIIKKYIDREYSD